MILLASPRAGLLSFGGIERGLLVGRRVGRADILISLHRQYHIIRPLEKHDGLFLYYVLDRSRSKNATP